MTFTQFTTLHNILVSSQRALDFRKIQLTPHQVLTHSLFGETREAFTDGVHVFAHFYDGVREVHFVNLKMKENGREAPVPKEKKINLKKTIVIDISWAEFV